MLIKLYVELACQTTKEAELHHKIFYI